MVQRSKPTYRLSLVLLFLVFLRTDLYGQSVQTSTPPCAHSESDIPHGQTAGAPSPLLSWDTIDDAAIVLEYSSVFDVHTPVNPSQPLRSQPGVFVTEHILDDLGCLVDPSAYDFVLIYSVQELPGWIHSGPRGIQAPAKNIGLPNAQFGAPSGFTSWPRLLLAPHMNSIRLTEESEPPNFGVLSAMHEMGHAWNVFWAQQSPGPREWQAGDPVAWLGACCGHWSWNWVDPQMPGMMYSAPTYPRFNEFDLYAMGLMTYAEAQPVSYEVYEDPGTGPPGPNHAIGLDDLIFSLSLRGAAYYEGTGQRIPATDPSVSQLTALLVVIRGSDEALTPSDKLAINKLADDLPTAWFQATQGRSSLTVKLVGTGQADPDSDQVLSCEDNCPSTANPLQQDTDNDGLGDVCDPCPHVSHPSFWDLDRQAGFTLHDLSIFQNCFSGPSPVTPQCSFVDFSGGGKIDLSDYIPLGELMTGNCD